MKNKEAMLAKNLAYLLFKKANKETKNKKIKRVIFYIDKDYDIDKKFLEGYFKLCIENTKFENTEIKFLYGYSIGTEGRLPICGPEVELETEDNICPRGELNSQPTD